MVSVAARKKKKNGASTAPQPQQEVAGWLRNRNVYLAAAALLVIAFGCYANALGNGFVFDDHGHVLADRAFRSISNIPKLLLASYRPLRNVSYVIDFAIWGERPFGFHLTSILIHLGNTLLVFLLIRRFTRGETLAAFFAASVFAIHPIQVDAVTYISGRRDVLFCLFYLLSFHFYLSFAEHRNADREERRRRLRVFVYFALFGIAWALSLLSKEMAASLPGLIFIWNFCDAWDKQADSWWRQLLRATKTTLSRDKWLYLAVSLAVPAYIWYQVFYTGGSERARASGLEYWGGSFYTNLLTSIRVHAWFLKQLVFPTPIVQYSGAFDVATTLFEWRVILSVIVVGATLAGGFLLLNRDKLLAFAVLSFFVLLSPVSQIIPHHELLADHYLYLPMMSFGLFLALIARKLSERSEMVRRMTYGFSVVVLMAFGVMTVMRNPVYKDDFSLWKTNYKEVPTSVRAVSSLAGQYATSYPARGAELYKQCIALDPSYSPPYGYLAALYQTRDKAREVEDLILQGLALPDSKVVSPGNEDPRRFRSELTCALAISKGFQGAKKDAEELLQKAIEIYPTNAQAYELLAAYYHSVDRVKEIETLKAECSIFPNDYYGLQILASRLIEDKRHDEALPYLYRMVAALPNDFFANYQLGQIHRNKSDCGAASRYLNTARAVAVEPSDRKTADDALIQLQQQCAGA